MITIIPIEPISDAHGMLIVEAFNMLFIDRGGKEDGWGYGQGNGDGGGYGGGYGNGRGYSYGNGYGDKCPEEWWVE